MFYETIHRITFRILQFIKLIYANETSMASFGTQVDDYMRDTYVAIKKQIIINI